MAKRRSIEVTPLGPDPDPLGSEADTPAEGDLLGRIFDRQREARLAAARDDADAAETPPDGQTDMETPIAPAEAPPDTSPQDDLVRRSHHRSPILQEGKNAILQDSGGGESQPAAPPGTRHMAVLRAEEMGRSSLRDIASRLPADLDRWLERVAFDYESEHGTRMPKQTLLKLAVQRLYIDTETRGGLPTLED